MLVEGLKLSEHVLKWLRKASVVYVNEINRQNLGAAGGWGAGGGGY